MTRSWPPASSVNTNRPASSVNRLDFVILDELGYLPLNRPGFTGG